MLVPERRDAADRRPRDRWDRAYQLPVLGAADHCLKCGAPSKVAFTLKLEGKQINRAWSCPLHQVEVQDAQIRWAEDKRIITRASRTA